MKRRILVRGVLVLILLLALYPLTKFVILPLFDTSGELEGHDVPLYGYSEPDTPMVMENDALRFELDPATTHFTLTDKRTGHVWLSSPDNADSDPIALPVEKNKLNSTLSLTYAASTGMTTQFTSQEHSISNGVYEVLMQEDGSVRVNYSVGRVQRSFLMPTAIGDARMQQFMEKMTSKQKKDIKEYYREYNIDKLRKTDDKAALLAAYPDLAEEHVWVLRDGTKDHLKQRCESIFAEVGYTAEDLAYDNSRIVQAGSTIAKAVFNVSMVFRLDGSDLVVEVPLDDLAYDVDYPLTSLTLLPAFGAGGTADNGFLFVPDGSGAIIRFNNGRVSQRAYYANLYGWDWASIRTQVTNETRINFPVFGVSGDSGSFICILEDGASWAGIGADIAGRLTSYNTVNATYTIVHGDAYDVSERTNNAVYMFETAHPTGFIRQRYRFLPESGYMDMAASYRDYLTAKYPNFAEQTVDADAPLSIELIGAIDKVQQVAGVPTSVPIAMTTYAEAKELLRELVTRNLAQNMSIRYAGWMNGGMNQQLLSSVRLIRQLGTQEELFSFAQNAAIAGVPLYLDGLTAFARDSGLLEGFIAFRDAARFTTREEAEIPEYSPIWYGANDDRDTYYLVKPAIAMRSVNTLVDAAASYGAGVSFRDIGYMLSADYDSKNHTTREAVLHQQAEKLAELKASGRDVMIRQGNDYAAVQATLITDMDFDGGQYSIIDEYVPFYPLALHSRVSYTGASLNLADDAEEVLLRSAEVGAGLQYTLTAQSARVLQDSTYSEFYGADASLVLDDITAQVAQYRQTLSGIFNQEMTGHERVGNVTITTYANGTRVYVNFGYTDAAVDGITVPARSCSATGGEQMSGKRISIRARRAVSGYLFILPFIIGFLCFMLLPLVDSFWMSLCRVDVTAGQGFQTTFIGLDNYIRAFTIDPEFNKLLSEEIGVMVTHTIAILVVSFVIAIVLNQEFKGRAFVRAIFFLPVILSSGVLIGLETDNTLMAGMQQMMAESSPFPLSESLMKILKLTGIGSDVLDIVFSLIDEVYDIVMASGIQIVVFLSGLQNVPRSLYEAADVEGCSKWEAFWTITFPMVSPLLIVNIIYTIIDFFMKTDSEVMKKINEEMTLKYNYGFSSAMAWVYFAITIVLIGASALMLKGVVSSDE